MSVGDRALKRGGVLDRLKKATRSALSSLLSEGGKLTPSASQMQQPEEAVSGRKVLDEAHNPKDAVAVEVDCCGELPTSNLAHHPVNFDSENETSGSREVPILVGEPVVGKDAADRGEQLVDAVSIEEVALSAIVFPARQNLLEMIVQVGASVRLTNCARREPIFAETSVEDFLSDLVHYEAALGETWSFGRKSWRELKMLALEHSLKAPFWPAIPLGHEGTEATGRLVHEHIASQTLGDLIQRYGASVRLSNCFERDRDAASLTIGDYVDDPHAFRLRLREVRSLGSKSLEELIALIEVELGGNKLAAEADGKNEHLLTARPPMTLRIPDDELRQWLQDQVNSLPERCREVIERRYGLISGQGETLEEISRTVRVTRERVRQVERKGLEKLRAARNRENLERFLRLEEKKAWQCICGDFPLLTKDDFRSRKMDLDPLFVLAADLVFDGLPAWLNEFGHKTFGGWISPWVDLEEVLTLRRTLPDIIRNAALPCSIERVAVLCGREVTDKQSLTVALLLTNGVSIHDGYVCQGTVGAVTRRTIALHRLSQTLDGAAFDVSRLANIYRRKYPEDLVSSRVIRMALQKHPSLFGNLYDNIWFRIPLGLRRRASVNQGVRTISDEEIEREYEEGSMGGWLIKLLAARGPMRMTEIVEEARKGGSRGLTLNSLGPIMLMSPSFERSANGVFALAEANAAYEDYAVTPPPVFLSEAHCRQVAYARYGETYWTLFPAWTEAYTYHLCTWARWNGSREVFRSLLSTVDPSAWEIPASERLQWVEAKMHLGAWQLGSERTSRLGTAFPRPRDVFSCLLFLRMHGGIGWLAAGRAAKIPFGHQTSVDTLAFLAAIGAVVAPENDWQLPHRATDRVDVLLDSFEKEVAAGREIDWNVGWCAKLLSQASSFDPHGTWIDKVELEQMLNSRDRSSVAFQGSRAVQDVDELLETDDWLGLFADTDEVTA